jgi:hypothetical protein
MVLSIFLNSILILKIRDRDDAGKDIALEVERLKKTE